MESPATSSADSELPSPRTNDSGCTPEAPLSACFLLLELCNFGTFYLSLGAVSILGTKPVVSLVRSRKQMQGKASLALVGGEKNRFHKHLLSTLTGVFVYE